MRDSNNIYIYIYIYIYISSPTEAEERSCNCRNKDNCPLDGSCLKTCIVYRADVIKHNGTQIYYGASDGEFKFRYKPTGKYFLLSLKKEVDQFVKFFVAMVRGVFIESPAFSGAYTCTDLNWGKRNLQ